MSCSCRTMPGDKSQLTPSILQWEKRKFRGSIARSVRRAKTKIRVYLEALLSPSLLPVRCIVFLMKMYNICNGLRRTIRSRKRVNYS